MKGHQYEQISLDLSMTASCGIFLCKAWEGYGNWSIKYYIFVSTFMLVECMQAFLMVSASWSRSQVTTNGSWTSSNLFHPMNRLDSTVFLQNLSDLFLCLLCDWHLDPLLVKSILWKPLKSDFKSLWAIFLLYIGHFIKAK